MCQTIVEFHACGCTRTVTNRHCAHFPTYAAKTMETTLSDVCSRPRCQAAASLIMLSQCSVLYSDEDRAAAAALQKMSAEDKGEAADGIQRNEEASTKKVEKHEETEWKNMV